MKLPGGIVLRVVLCYIGGVLGGRGGGFKSRMCKMDGQGIYIRCRQRSIWHPQLFEFANRGVEELVCKMNINGVPLQAKTD